MKNLQINTDFGYSQDNYYCQENIEHLRGDTYIYVDWGNVAMPKSLEDLFEILPQNNKKRKLIQFLKDSYDGSYYNPNYEDFTSFENVVAYIFGDYSIETMKDFVNNLIDFGIEVTPKFDRYISRGYSQGDACEIFVPHSLREVWGLANDAEVLTKDLQKQIDHYLWDSEIYGTIDISFEYEVRRETFGDSVIMKFAEEFEYGEWSNDTFEFDLDVDNILKCINRVTNNVLNEDEMLEIRKSLESLDQSDVKYN